MTEENPQYNRADCYFCNNQHTELLETHHIVPARYGGSDEAENLVKVCPTCHRKLEYLYDGRFYEQLPTKDVDDDPEIVTPDSEGGRKRSWDAKEIVSELESENEHGAPIPKIKERFQEENIPESALTKLKQSGEAYTNGSGYIRTT